MEANVDAGKMPLRINTDETSSCVFQGKGKGAVFVKKARQKVSKS